MATLAMERLEKVSSKHSKERARGGKAEEAETTNDTTGNTTKAAKTAITAKTASLADVVKPAGNETNGTETTEVLGGMIGTAVSEAGHEPKLADYARRAPVASSDALCKDMLQLFDQYSDCECIVIEGADERVAGLAMRHRFSYKLAHRYSVALFYNKPALGLVDQEPIVVDIGTDPRELIDLAMSRQGDSLYDCIILTRNERYAGVLTVGDLLALLKALQQNAVRSQAETLRSATGRIQGIADSVRNVQESSVAGDSLSMEMVNLTLQGKEELTLVKDSFRALEQSSVRQEERMKDLQRETGAIGVVSQMIKEMAEQCNLLSINASIEAARAGEMGKGFGIVAGEFMKLADQTKKSALEITAITTAIIKSIEAAADQVAAGREQTAASGRHIEAANEVYHRIFKAAAGNRDSADTIGQLAGEAHGQALRALGEMTALQERLQNDNEASRGETSFTSP